MTHINPVTRSVLDTCDAALHRLEGCLSPQRSKVSDTFRAGKSVRHFLPSSHGVAAAAAGATADRKLLSRLRSDHVWLLMAGLSVVALAMSVTATPARAAEVARQESIQNAAQPPAAMVEPAKGAELAKVDEKTITGEVMGMTKRSISIEYSRTTQESFDMLMPVDDKTQFTRLESLADLHHGDTITVTYRQWSTVGADGVLMVMKSVAKDVTLIRRAQQNALGSREDASP